MGGDGFASARDGAAIVGADRRTGEAASASEEDPGQPVRSSGQRDKSNREETVEGSPKRGPKQGHPGTMRAATEPPVKNATRVERCDRCGQELGAAQHRLVERRQLVEIPPIEPVVIEAAGYQAECSGCGQPCLCVACKQRHTAAFPAVFTAGVGGRAAGAGAGQLSARSAPCAVWASRKRPPSW